MNKFAKLYDVDGEQILILRFTEIEPLTAYVYISQDDVMSMLPIPFDSLEENNKWFDGVNENNAKAILEFVQKLAAGEAELNLEINEGDK